VASDDDDVPLLTDRLSEGMVGSSTPQQCTGNLVAFAQITCALCFLFFFKFHITFAAVIICFLLGFYHATNMHGTMYAVVMYLCLSHLYIICFPISITYYVLTLYHFQTAEPIIKTQD